MIAPFDFDRFITAQNGVYRQVIAELTAGQKRSHWMWFIFPQIAGLGQSSTAQFYALGGRGEASAYLEHPLLGRRLRECADLVANSAALSATALFGSIDALKLCSSMTLFSAVRPDDATFTAVLDKYYGGQPDPRTLDLLDR